MPRLPPELPGRGRESWRAVPPLPRKPNVLGASGQDRAGCRVIVGLVGAAGSGKDAVAEILIRKHGFIRIAFADEVKRIARDDFGWDGRKDAKGRRLLQRVGTECGRAYDPDIWIKKLRLDPRFSTSAKMVIPDVRFQNEAHFIGLEGGVVARIGGRRGYYRWWHPAYWHRSEREARRIKADMSLDNSGTLADLERVVDTWMYPQNS